MARTFGQANGSSHHGWKAKEKTKRRNHGSSDSLDDIHLRDQENFQLGSRSEMFHYLSIVPQTGDQAFNTGTLKDIYSNRSNIQTSNRYLLSLPCTQIWSLFFYVTGFYVTIELFETHQHKQIMPCATTLQ